MHRLLSLFSILAAGMTGCTTDSGDEGFHIKHNLSGDDQCVISPGGLFKSRGEIYMYSPVPYIFTPEIESRLTALEGQEDQRTIALRGARVSLDVVAVSVDNQSVTPPTLANGQFRSLFAASLPPGGSVGASLDLIPTTVLGELAAMYPTGSVRAEVVATVTVYGAVGGGGDEIDGVPFIYPVAVCNDCIVNDLGACPLPMGSMPSAGNPCNPFQDGFVDCCSDGEDLVCPAIVSTTAAN